MVDVRRFFIADNALSAQYAQAQIASNRLTASGIPVRAAFLGQYDPATTRRSLQLPEDKRLVLLFSGSIGCGRLHHVAPKLEKVLPEDAHLVILCGHNKRTYEKLQGRCGPNATIVGYTDRVAEYMSVADLCISKPGGLSITEMLSMQLPMILMLSVPGCESHNLAFFEERKMAIATHDWQEAIEETVHLLQNANKLQTMRENLVQFGYPGGASVILREVLSDYESVKSEGV